MESENQSSLILRRLSAASSSQQDKGKKKPSCFSAAVGPTRFGPCVHGTESEVVIEGTLNIKLLK